MADLSEIKKILQDLRRNQLDIILRLEILEEKVAAGGGGAPSAPEPILTCVQCQEDYKESQNAEGYCNYHPSPLQGAGWDYIFKCCNQKSRNYDSAKYMPGCKKGKHCSEHHENYPYAAYTTFMMDTVKKARQVWLEVDVDDFVAVGCKWAEVGLSEDDKVYIACGENRIKYNGIKLLSMEQLKEYTNEGSSVLLNKTGDPGWSIMASMIVGEGLVRAIEVSVKSSSSSKMTTKRVTLNLTGAIPAVESVQDMSDAVQKTVRNYVLPEDVTEGPVIDVGQDYSKDRKNDYTAETDDGFTLKIKQKGLTDADSSWCAQKGKWNNLFTAVMMLTNTGDSDLAITNMEGYYCRNGDGLGEWVKCDDGWVGERSFRDYHFYDTSSFTIKSAHTSTMAIRLCIRIEGDKPPSGSLAGRADCSLPQPLHLKAVFTDHNERKASIRFEFGNPPLDLITREKGARESRLFGKPGVIYSYCFADNLENFTRCDATISCRNDNGVLAYIPSLEDNAFCIYYLGSKMEEFAYKAKQAEKAEFEIEDYAQKDNGTEIKAYVLVDLDNEIAYGFKVMIKTPTSLATTHCMLPQFPDPSEISLTISPEHIKAGNEVTIKWKVTRAFKRDHIYVYTEYGKNKIEEMCIDNENAELTGEVTLKAPITAGVYEARYYPAALDSSNTDKYHDIYWMKAKFTVTAICL